VANWWVDTQPGPAFPGGTTTGGGGNAGVVQYRSPLDAARAAQGQIGQAQYPDGYLGTITNRREDRLLEKIQEKLTDRSYQRGVHKGAKIAPTDYFWDKNGVDPDSGLKKEFGARREGYTIPVPRHVPAGNPVERLAHLGKTAGLSAPSTRADEGR
jgi:hypothetical protein